MRDGIVELAMLFRARDNKSLQGIGVGEVVSNSPLKISFNTFLLEKDRLIMAKKLSEEELKVGDKIIVIPSTDNARYFVVDKVGG